MVDDNMRNRQLMSQGRVVLPVTKEDLYGEGRLDELTWHILRQARLMCRMDTHLFFRLSSMAVVPCNIATLQY